MVVFFGCFVLTSTVSVYGDVVEDIRFHSDIFNRMKVKLIGLKKKEIGKRKWKGRGLSLSYFIKEIKCDGESKWKGRIEKIRGNEKERLLNSMVV